MIKRIDYDDGSDTVIDDIVITDVETLQLERLDSGLYNLRASRADGSSVVIDIRGANSARSKVSAVVMWTEPARKAGT